MTPEQWRQVVEDAVVEAAPVGTPAPIVAVEETAAGWRVTVQPAVQTQPPSEPTS